MPSHWNILQIIVTTKSIYEGKHSTGYLQVPRLLMNSAERSEMSRDFPKWEKESDDITFLK